MKERTLSRLIDFTVLIVGAATIIFVSWVYGNVQYDRGYQAAVIDSKVGRVTSEYGVKP